MKHVLAVGVLVFALLLSWCSVSEVEQPVEQSTVPTTHTIKEQHIASYTDTVDHTKKSLRQQTIDLTPQKTSIQFYDNAPETEIWSYGTWVAPRIIRAKVGDELTFKVTNNLPQETTVHRHGVRVPFDQDWVPWFTQEPIQPWEEYTYTYTVWDPGTYWFHTHVNTSEQIARWLYGLLIVEEETPRWEYDQERVWALKDYRLNEDGTMNMNFDNMMDRAMAGRLGNTRTINNTIAPTYNALPGSKVLIRLANTSSARIYNLDLRDWDARVVESDGWPIQELYQPSILQMWVGERYTLLVDMPQDTTKLLLKDIYFPDAPSDLLSVEVTWSPQEQTTITPVGDETLPDRRDLKWSEPDFTVELWGVNVSGGDRMEPGAERGWTIDDTVFPKHDATMEHTNPLFHMEIGKMYTVRLTNNSMRDHPMHLHGDFFQVVSVNDKSRPYAGWKDTINVPAKWYVDIAMIPTNPWTWMFHCHINEHADFGMMATIKIE